ncbi:MAG: helix-turn-helix transcriptional regulator [Planctomycetota bacterium]
MQTFDDFDAWGDAVSGAHLSMACDRVESPLWQLAVRNLGPVVVQMAHEGGGNLCYGANAHAGLNFFLPLTNVAEHVANCERLDEGSLLVIPPGGDFRIRVRHRAHGWCSIALPPEVTLPIADNSTTAPPASRVVRPGIDCVRKLKNLITRSASSPCLAEPLSPAHAVAAKQLIEAGRACIDSADRAPQTCGRPKIDRCEIIRRVIACLETESLGRPTVAELALKAGVTQRTLCRAFQDTYGVSPLGYINLRLLHSVRRGLRTATPDETTVSNVLTRYGIWDHGRFAARYRRQFGEALSNTLHRNRR